MPAAQTEPPRLAQAIGSYCERAAGTAISPWVRVIASLDLLASDASVMEAALAVGYASPSAFAAAFREVMGETPTA